MKHCFLLIAGSKHERSCWCPQLNVEDQRGIDIYPAVCLVVFQKRDQLKL